MSKSRRRHTRRGRSRRSRKGQRGGAGCAAIPVGNSPFAQKGGMAPFGSAGMLLDQPTIVQAQSAQQLGDIQAATSMAKAFSAQIGGRRRRTHRKRHSRRRHHRRQKSRRQRGGGAQSATYGPFNDLLRPSLIAGSPQALGQNPQFVTEAGVNPLFAYERGAQF